MQAAPFCNLCDWHFNQITSLMVSFLSLSKGEPRTAHKAGGTLNRRRNLSYSAASATAVSSFLAAAATGNCTGFRSNAISNPNRAMQAAVRNSGVKAAA